MVILVKIMRGLTSYALGWDKATDNPTNNPTSHTVMLQTLTMQTLIMDELTMQSFGRMAKVKSSFALHLRTQKRHALKTRRELCKAGVRLKDMQNPKERSKAMNPSKPLKTLRRQLISSRAKLPSTWRPPMRGKCRLMSKFQSGNSK
jgi:hypothetical protein